MLLAGGIAHERGREEGEANAYQQEQAYAPPPAPPPAAPAEVDATSEIERLSSLHDSGALSDDEFAAAKQKVLGI
jgi:hypothetical protein